MLELGRNRERGGGRERESRVGSVLSAQSPAQGSNPRTVRPWPGPEPRVDRPTEPRRCPSKAFSKKEPAKRVEGTRPLAIREQSKTAVRDPRPSTQGAKWRSAENNRGPGSLPRCPWECSLVLRKTDGWYLLPLNKCAPRGPAKPLN